jgi:hypothetical protein
MELKLILDIKLILCCRAIRNNTRLGLEDAEARSIAYQTTFVIPAASN